MSQHYIENSKSDKTVVLLPYNTPSEMFDDLTSKMFHPMTLLNNVSKRKKNETTVYKLPHCVTGCSVLRYAVKLGYDVIITISDEESPARQQLKLSIEGFAEPSNPFALISYIETSSKTIANQVADVFAQTDYEQVIVVWPYQMLNADKQNFEVYNSNMNNHFTYAHPLLMSQRKGSPEVVLVAASGQNATSDTEITCSSALSVGTIDELLLGAFSRILTSVKIPRDEFENFRITSQDSSDISCFVSSFLKDKKGTMINPEGHSFIN